MKGSETFGCCATRMRKANVIELVLVKDFPLVYRLIPLSRIWSLFVQSVLIRKGSRTECKLDFIENPVHEGKKKLKYILL